MDITPEKYISNGKGLNQFLTNLQRIFSVAEWPINFFTLTTEERFMAGIFLGGEGRDE